MPLVTFLTPPFGISCHRAGKASGPWRIDFGGVTVTFDPFDNQPLVFYHGYQIC